MSECQHGHLPRQCELCERDAEIERLNRYINQLGDEKDRLMSLVVTKDAEIERLRGSLQGIIDYPPPGHQRADDDGYPVEFDYDEFAYKRMVDTYRQFARESLGEPEEGGGG